jgi:hypothetical protein
MSRIQRTTVWVRDKFRALIPFIKNHPRKSGVVALACLALIIVFSLNKTPTSTSDQTPLRTVQVASLLSLSQEENAVPLVGEVRSRSRAELRTLAPGEVVRVFAK